MKKILALILVAVMFLSLCACGGESANTDTNGSTQQSEQLPSESIENAADDADVADDVAANTENPYADNPNFQNIFGQWELPEKDSYLQDEMPCSALTINEDGTCIVDGVSRTWSFPDDAYIDDYGIGENLLDIIIYIDEECQLIVRYYCIYEWIGVFPYGYMGAVETSWVKTSATEE